ncbi:MAG: InlB B-repeat-containing protein [Saccharofermentanales bacterium]
MKKRIIIFSIVIPFMISLFLTDVISESASYTLLLGSVVELHNSQYSDDGLKTWESSDPSVASIVRISSSGSDCTIRAAGLGDCDVVVNIRYPSFETQWIPDNLGGGRWGTVPVVKSESFVYHISVIKTQPKVITDIRVRYSTGKTICMNESFRFPVDIRSGNGWYIDTYSTLEWLSSDDTVASVDDYGVVKAKAAGKATITVKTPEGLSATAQITVTDFSGYTRIASKQALSDIRKNPGGRFYLAGNIVFQDSDFQAGGAFYNGGKKWIPIPDFIGVLNGNNFSVENLQVDATGDAGLFSSITAQSGTLSNLTIRNADIIGSGNVGAFCGYSKGVFSNCVSAGSTLRGLCTGGIAGIQDNGQINSCTNTSAIYGDEIAGGLVGKPVWSAQIWFCTNKGPVFSAKAGDAGGIAGFADYSNILYCVNEGSVTGTFNTGGIAGRHKSGKILFCSNKGRITSNPVGSDTGADYSLGGISGYMNLSSVVGDCYNTGTIESRSNVGTANAGGIAGTLYINDYKPGGNDRLLYNSYNLGLIGPSDPKQKCNAGGIAGAVTNSSSCASVTAIWNSYYLDNAAAACGYAPGGNHSDNVAGLSDTQLKSSASFKGFIFDSDWVLDNAGLFPYPQFRYSYHPVVNDDSSIIFRASGEDAYSSVKVRNGQLLPKPADPALQGYIFTGWYKDPAYMQKWDFSADKVAGSLALFAKWIAADGNMVSGSMTGTDSGSSGSDGWIGSSSNQSKADGESMIQNGGRSGDGGQESNGVSGDDPLPAAPQNNLTKVLIITTLILIAIGGGIIITRKAK